MTYQGEGVQAEAVEDREAGSTRATEEDAMARW
jgi:hypothetical protein